MWLLILLAILAILIYLNFIKPLKYWEEKGIPYLKPIPFFGNMASNAFQRRAVVYLMDDFYKAFPNKRYFGIYQFSQPTLLIRDLELIKNITVRYFDTFPDHKAFSAPADPLWSKNLFALTSENGWQDMRATLSPAFTSSKMKSMFILMQQCATQFVNHFQNQEGPLEIEFRDAFARYSNDVIGTATFGVTCDSLKNRDNEFYLMGKDATDLSGLKILKYFGYAISPPLMKLFKVTLFSKEVSTFFRGLIKETLRIRKEKQIVRPDIIHLLMEARKGSLKYEDEATTIDSGFAIAEESKLGRIKRKNLEITDEDITANAILFFVGGFDTTANLMSFVSYELALNPLIQSRLCEEIDAATKNCKGQQIPYETLLGMKYLDCVVSETLRKWPFAPFLDRCSTKPFTIEPELPGEKPLELEAGTVCWIPVYSIHRDPKYYCEPEKFDPDRFNDENKHKIKPFTYMPFGSGPRNCIGSRFAIVETKLIIVELLRKFEIVPIKKTEIPLVISKTSFNSLPENGVWLGLHRRTTSD